MSDREPSSVSFHRSIWPAAAVHAFTSLGAVCALLAMEAIFAQAWERVFLWLGVAFIIDGIDGTFARLARVGERLPRFSGEYLDLVVDYVTYVFVPVVALRAAGYLPGTLGLVLAAAILLSSLYHFAHLDSKAADYSFVGFPAVWNIVAFYVFALALPVWAVAVIVAACAALTFVPMLWVHPLRVTRLRLVTLAMTGLWGYVTVAIVAQGFPAQAWQAGALVLVLVYGLGLTVASAYAREH